MEGKIMILLYILLGIILLFALLFSLNLKFYIRLEDELTIHAGVGPVILKLAPKKEKEIDLADFTYEKHMKRLEKERKAAQKKAAKKSAKDEKKRRQKALTEEAQKAASSAEQAEDENKLAPILDIISFALGEIPRFFSYFHADIRLLDITVGGADADVIARKYGKVSALVSLLIELLDSKTKLKKIKSGAVQVRADFLREKITYKLHIRIKLRVFSLVRVLMHTIGWMIRQKISEMRSSPARSNK